MILSTQTDYLSRQFGIEKAIDIIADAGFDAIDLTMFDMKSDDSVFCQDDYKELALNLLKKAQNRGLFFNQAHGPFPCSKNNDDDYNSKIYTRIARSIEIAGIVGAKCIVIHPMHHLPYLENSEKLKEINMEFYRSLAPFAKAAGVKIALENMWQRNSEKKIVVSACSRTKEFADWIDTLNDDCFTACLDLGHSGLYGFDAAEQIKGLGNRLGALHVHDNDYQSDAHTAPYLGKMHWDTICEALATVGYKGDLTLEADNFFNSFPKELAPMATKFLHDIGRNLIERVKTTQV